ncbi:MAG TPA: hypothetical protein VE619_10435 [Nitrososphaeraceae archaeon]|nr:hypothetical protein [Nitrososphaeraceae archaeon]
MLTKIATYAFKQHYEYLRKLSVYMQQKKQQQQQQPQYQTRYNQGYRISIHTPKSGPEEI